MTINSTQLVEAFGPTVGLVLAIIIVLSKRPPPAPRIAKHSDDDKILEELQRMSRLLQAQGERIARLEGTISAMKGD